MVILGSAHISKDITNFMMDKVQVLAPEDVAATRALFHKLSLLSRKIDEATDAPAASQRRPWTDAISPFAAKRARQLTLEPSETSLDGKKS